MQILDQRTGVDKLTGKQVAKPTNIKYDSPRANPSDYRAGRSDYYEQWDEELGKNVWQEASQIGKRSMQEGGTVWNTNSSAPSSEMGMLSRVMGPRGEMPIPTRLGGFKVG